MPARPFRSVLYVPGSNARALAKLAGLTPDAVILDLEDAVPPDQKFSARERVAAFLSARAAGGPHLTVRINPLGGEWGGGDLAALLAGPTPDVILLPKVEGPRDILEAGDRIDEADPGEVRLWAMIETPRAVLNLGATAELGRDPASRLAGLVAGANDLAAALGVADERRHLAPHLAQIVLAARAGGLLALDGVFNDFSDTAGFEAEAKDGAAMGFDGKTLIHPGQIEAANRAFSPSAEAVAEARAVVQGFAAPENADKGVIVLNGRMVERLHLARAKSVLARVTLDAPPSPLVGEGAAPRVRPLAGPRTGSGGG